MTKIKNFRLTLRPREIGRWLKRERGMEITPDLELAIDSAINEGRKHLQTAALYTTLTHTTVEKTTPLSLPSKAVAASVISVTLGPALEAQRQADPEKEAFWAAIQEEALAQAIQFAVRLVQEQAKEEDCELSPATVAQEPDLWGPLTSLLATARIGLEIDPAAPVLPAYARLAWVAWLPLRKSGGRRPETPARPEKAAV